MTLHRRFIILAILSCVAGVVMGGAMLYAGFSLNPQGEFYDPETLDVAVGYSFMLFTSWFIPAFIVVFVAGFVLWGCWVLLRLPGERYTAIAVVLCILGGILLLAYGLGDDFWKIDACLDRGGRWNYDTRACEYE